jgi:uncharacterized protein (DUF934 family)
MEKKMARIIKEGRIADDAWQWVAADEALTPERLAGDENLLLPLPLWLAHRQGRDRTRTGVWLASDDPVDALLPWLAELPLIAIHFPVFTDGRGYSLAQLLRRHGYGGELRAVGDVLRDQIYFLHRCGFDSFRLREGQPLEEALVAFSDYSWAPVTGRQHPGDASGG